MDYFEIDGNIFLKDEIKYLLTIYKEHRGADFLFQHHFNQLPEDIKNEIEKIVIQQMSNYRILSKKHSENISIYLNRWCTVPSSQEMLRHYHHKRYYDMNSFYIYTQKENTFMYYHCDLSGYTMGSYKIQMLEDRFLITSNGYNQNGVDSIYDVLEPYDSIQHELTIIAAMLDCAGANDYSEDYIFNQLAKQLSMYNEQVENDTLENIFYNIQKHIYVHHFFGSIFLAKEYIDIISKYKFKDGLFIEGDLSILMGLRPDICNFILNSDSLSKYY